MTRVDEDEVLLLYRALRTFRAGRNPACAPRGRPRRSECPLYGSCGRWAQPDDEGLSREETLERTEARRATWPCSRVLDALAPGVTRIGG